jgi:3,4-dihydroxy 2-butanone 4-phosphate synthase/GTP cyclohydrolase II
MRLITNNPRKLAGLKGFGIEIVGRKPLLIETNEYNRQYLETKAEKLGHLLLESKLVTIGIRWTEAKSTEWLDQLREVAAQNDLLLQEENSHALASLFSNADTQNPLPSDQDISSQLSLLHLGFDRSKEIAPDWYEQPSHPYRQAIVKLLKQLKQWEQISTFRFCVALDDSDLPESFVETINLGLAWNNAWKSDRMYEWFNVV